MPVLDTGVHAPPPIDRFRRWSVGARAHVQWAPLRRWNNVDGRDKHGHDVAGPDG